MNIFLWKRFRILSLSALLVFLFQVSWGQLSAPGHDMSGQTNYPVFPENDVIYYFHGAKDHKSAVLRGDSSGFIVDFRWEKYNKNTGAFEPYHQEIATSSTIQNLEDGCYRLLFRENGRDMELRAWVFNSWIESAASVIDFDCTSIHLSSGLSSSAYVYYDISSGQQVNTGSNYEVGWYRGSVKVSSRQNPVIYDPPYQDTDYRFEVTDRSGMTASSTTTYHSIIPKAEFSFRHEQNLDAGYTHPEAPVEILFTNESTNADPERYEWFLFRDIDDIKKESAESGQPVDSIMTTLYEINPAYTYENSGQYMVKLVAAKETDQHLCLDTFYLENYIVLIHTFPHLST